MTDAIVLVDEYSVVSICAFPVYFEFCLVEMMVISFSNLLYFSSAKKHWDF